MGGQCNVLQHFETATQSMSGENYCIGYQMITTTTLSKEFFLDGTKNVILNILEGLDDRLGNIEKILHIQWPLF